MKASFLLSRGGLILLLLCTSLLGAQEFGFGAPSPLRLSIGGQVSATLLGYTKELSEGPGGFDKIHMGDVFSGKLNFHAQSSLAEAYINLTLEPSPQALDIDEAYLTLFMGQGDLSAGFRKITWGRADTMGPLDVINPLKSGEIYLIIADGTSLMEAKIARPLLHLSYRLGTYSKIEGVFVPSFQGHQMSTQGRWADSRLDKLSFDSLPPDLLLMAGLYGIDLSSIEVDLEGDTSTLDFAQGGLRFTSTIGGADLGLQYYYGRLPLPSVEIDYHPLLPLPQRVALIYNRYHQIGVDYAQVLSGFNTRAEVAANITEDRGGDDGSIYNPAIIWSLGFDRDLFLGVHANLQATQSIRLMADKVGGTDIGAKNFDIEGDSLPTSTRLSAALSRKFLQDQIELRCALVWGIEDQDFLFMPALVWSRDEIRFSLAGGFFQGPKDSKGQLGQYQENNFIKAVLSYRF
ncbi:MAG: hypothetical protein FWH12_05420 [Treponema sp.]|nr:hypothetical protein [Treponema sp.]